MGEIIKFKRKERKVSDAKRLKALCEGRIRYFSCNDCGGDIEVIDEEYPDKCPCCGLKITEWEKTKENK